MFINSVPSVTEASGAVGLFVNNQVNIPDFICHNCISAACGTTQRTHRQKVNDIVKKCSGDVKTFECISAV